MILPLVCLCYKCIRMTGGLWHADHAQEALCKQVRPKEQGIALQVAQGFSGAELLQGWVGQKKLDNYMGRLNSVGPWQKQGVRFGHNLSLGTNQKPNKPC